MRLQLPQLSNHAQGTLIAVTAILILSPDSLILRHLEHIPQFTVIFYRFFFFASSLSLCILATSGWHGFLQKFKDIGWVGLIAGLVLGIGNIMITYALLTTPAAVVLVINASNSMFSALFSYLILKEVAPWYTILAGVVCIGAIFAIFYSQLTGGANFVGLVASVTAAICLGLYFVLLRLMEQLCTSTLYG